MRWILPHKATLQNEYSLLFAIYPTRKTSKELSANYLTTVMFPVLCTGLLWAAPSRIL